MHVKCIFPQRWFLSFWVILMILQLFIFLISLFLKGMWLHDWNLWLTVTLKTQTSPVTRATYIELVKGNCINELHWTCGYLNLQGVKAPADPSGSWVYLALTLGAIILVLHRLWLQKKKQAGSSSKRNILASLYILAESGDISSIFTYSLWSTWDLHYPQYRTADSLRFGFVMVIIADVSLHH